MQRLALLIGSPFGGLVGVKTDLEVMREILEANNFTTTTIPEATRAQILQGWASVTGKLSRDDAVVFYYSGHGGLAPRDADRDAYNKDKRRLQYLVPMDFEETTEGDWRGITDVELSGLLRSATDKTKNVTIILDCCHAARMARLPGTLKAIDPRDYRHIYEHIERMLKDGRFGRDFHPERNPDVVTIAASMQTDSAWEQPFVRDKETKVMSVLVEALDRAVKRIQSENASPDQVSWRTLMQHIRDRVKVSRPQQSPRVEGDDLRLTFSLDKADRHGAIPAKVNDQGQVVLEGGKIHGLREKDVYSLLPFQDERHSPAREIAEVVVTGVGPTEARTRFEGDRRPTEQHKLDGMKAFLKKRELGKLPVTVQGSTISTELIDAINESNFLLVADADESTPLAQVIQSETRLQLYNHNGSSKYLLSQWELGQDGTKDQGQAAASCVARLENLAHCRHVLTLGGSTPSNTLAQQIDLELGLVLGSEAKPWSGGSLTVVEGERVYLKVSNHGPRTVFVSIFDLFADSAELVSCSYPTGNQLSPGDSYTFGSDGFTSKIQGSEVSWPEGIPRENGRIPEHFVVVVTNKARDLRPLETKKGSSRSTHDFSEFSRGASLKTSSSLEFGVRHISFELACKA